MPIKLILSICLVVIVTVFTGFNLNNKTDVWLFFHTFKEAPVYMVILISFVTGVLVTLPFTFIKKRSPDKKPSEKPAKKDSKKKTSEKMPQPLYEDEAPVVPEAPKADAE